MLTTFRIYVVEKDYPNSSKMLEIEDDGLNETTIRIGDDKAVKVDRDDLIKVLKGLES